MGTHPNPTYTKARPAYPQRLLEDTQHLGTRGLHRRRIPLFTPLHDANRVGGAPVSFIQLCGLSITESHPITDCATQGQRRTFYRDAPAIGD